MNEFWGVAFWYRIFINFETDFMARNKTIFEAFRWTTCCCTIEDRAKKNSTVFSSFEHGSSYDEMMIRLTFFCSPFIHHFCPGNEIMANIHSDIAKINVNRLPFMHSMIELHLIPKQMIGIIWKTKDSYIVIILFHLENSTQINGLSSLFLLETNYIYLNRSEVNWWLL